jgi:hypothetical protein
MENVELAKSKLIDCCPVQLDFAAPSYRTWHHNSTRTNLLMVESLGVFDSRHATTVMISSK